MVHSNQIMYFFQAFTKEIPLNTISDISESKVDNFLIQKRLKLHFNLIKITYLLEVLWGQPIKLIQVVLLQNFMNIDGPTLILFFSSPTFSAGPKKPQTLTPSKIKYENF